jgi:hypothetical protein
VRDDDFLGIAACELWEHYCPERPSVEMLDDWMQEGYDLSTSPRGWRTCGERRPPTRNSPPASSS